MCLLGRCASASVGMRRITSTGAWRLHNFVAMAATFNYTDPSVMARLLERVWGSDHTATLKVHISQVGNRHTDGLSCSVKLFLFRNWNNVAAMERWTHPYRQRTENFKCTHSITLLRKWIQAYSICQFFLFTYSALRFAEVLETIPDGTDWVTWKQTTVLAIKPAANTVWPVSRTSWDHVFGLWEQAAVGCR